MKKKKFLNKMVNLVDKTLRKAGNLDEKITIYWNDEDMTMSFYHYNYGFAGTYTVANLYERYNNECCSDVKRKVKEHPLCQTFADDVVLDMKMFIREKRNPIIVKTPFERTIYIDKNFENCDEEVDDELCDKDCHTCDGSICCSDKEDNDEKDNCLSLEALEEHLCNTCDCGVSCEGRDCTDDVGDCSKCEKNEYNKLGEEESPTFPDVEKVDLKKIDELTTSKAPTCPKCSSQNAKKNGKKAGKQQWICKDCGRYFTKS